MLKTEAFSASKLIPYGFAKSRGVFVNFATPELAEIYVREGSGLESLAEIRRVLRGKSTLKMVSVGEYDKLLADTYSQDGASSAFAEDLESNLDLSKMLQELPEVEDLLEAEGDAPIIRMINAIFTQALREGASDIHVEPYEIGRAHV